MVDLEELKKLAEDVKTYPWYYKGPSGPANNDPDNNFIAAANPETILKLIEIVQIAREVNSYCFHPQLMKALCGVRDD